MKLYIVGEEKFLHAQLNYKVLDYISPKQPLNFLIFHVDMHARVLSMLAIKSNVLDHISQNQLTDFIIPCKSCMSKIKITGDI